MMKMSHQQVLMSFERAIFTKLYNLKFVLIGFNSLTVI